MVQSPLTGFNGEGIVPVGTRDDWMQEASDAYNTQVMSVPEVNELQR